MGSLTSLPGSLLQAIAGCAVLHMASLVIFSVLTRTKIKAPKPRYGRGGRRHRQRRAAKQRAALTRKRAAMRSDGRPCLQWTGPGGNCTTCGISAHHHPGAPTPAQRGCKKFVYAGTLSGGAKRCDYCCLPERDHGRSAVPPSEGVDHV